MKNKIIKSIAALSIVATTAFAGQAPAPQGVWLGLPYAGTIPEGMVANMWLTSFHSVKDFRGTDKQKVSLIQAVLRVGLSNGWGARVAIPNPIVKVGDETMNRSTGNSAIFIEKTLLNQRAGDPITLAVDAGLGVPTSKANSGYGYKFATRASWLNAPHYINIGALGHWWTKADSYKEGALYQFTALYAYALNREFDIFTELEYSNQKANTFSAGHQTFDRGISKNGQNTTLYSSLGVAWKNKVGVFNFGVALPLHSKYKGANNVANDDAKAQVRYGTFFIIPLYQPKN